MQFASPAVDSTTMGVSDKFNPQSFRKFILFSKKWKS